MDHKQFTLFVSALRTYYPKENILPNNQALKLWYLQLQDIPYKVAEATLNKWVAVNKWSPSIADIREEATKITLGERMSWSEAWETVLKAISRYGTYRADEGLESLEPLTRKVIKRLGFTNLCTTDNIGVERANFRLIYEQELQRQTQDAQMPPNVKALINNALMIEGATDEK